METIGAIRPMQDFFRRWYVVNHQGLAWAGSRWVPMVGPIQACNFDSQGKAEKFIAAKFPPEVTERRISERRRWTHRRWPTT